jgi:DNA-binding transcriptional LysR family regulator
MELRQLRSFLVVAEKLNISAAARSLHITQPALSRQILDLENEVSQALFLREHGKLRLTPAGANLQKYGTKAVSAVDEALSLTRETPAQTDTRLRVGYYGVAWVVLVKPALSKLRREFPHLTLSLTEQSPTQLAAELVQGRLDVVVLNRNPKWEKDFVALRVAKVPMVLALPTAHALTHKRLVSLDDLRKERIVSFTRQAGFGRDRQFVSACREAGFSPKISYEALSLSGLLLLVATQSRVALVTAMARRGPHPGVTFRKLRTPVQIELYAARARTAGSAARRLTELIAEEGSSASLTD